MLSVRAGRPAKMPGQKRRHKRRNGGIEVARPAYDTLVAVAKALQLPLEEVLTAASYEVHRPEAVESRIGKRLEPLLLQVPSDRRPAIEAAIEQVTRAMVGAATV